MKMTIKKITKDVKPFENEELKTYTSNIEDFLSDEEYIKSDNTLNLDAVTISEYIAKEMIGYNHYKEFIIYLLITNKGIKPGFINFYGTTDLSDFPFTVKAIKNAVDNIRKVFNTQEPRHMYIIGFNKYDDNEIMVLSRNKE